MANKTRPADPAPVVLAAARTSLVVDAAGPGVPRVLHWGADIGRSDEPESIMADLVRAGVLPDGGPVDRGGQLTVPLLPAEADGWLGRPGLSGHRDGRAGHLRLTLTRPVDVSNDSGRGGLTAELADAVAGVEVTSELRLSPQGVLRMRLTVRNTAPGVWTLDGALCLLPVPADAAEVLDTTGHWARERTPQRTAFGHGALTHENRRGKTGFDGPPLYVAGTPGCGFRHGEVWGVHVGWSGNHQYLAQRLPEFDAVLGGLSDRMHAFLRARPEHPRAPRPLTLNTWEAVYFDHSLDRLTALADRAAAIGVERFVLDDGWFRGRRDDTAGLGDWYVDPDVWPDGLGPLVSHVRKLGMRFGLWVEPEMINPESELARAHPDWVLAAPGRTPRRSATSRCSTWPGPRSSTMCSAGWTRS
jgi:alpha-galactosidase